MGVAKAAPIVEADEGSENEVDESIAEASGSKSSAKDVTPKGVKGEQKKSDEDSDDDDADYSEDFQDGTVDAENSKSFLGASQSPAASAAGQVSMSKEVAAIKPKVEAHQASDGEDDGG